jgi:hypothetical protein
MDAQDRLYTPISRWCHASGEQRTYGCVATACMKTRFVDRARTVMRGSAPVDADLDESGVAAGGRACTEPGRGAINGT